MTIAYEPLRKLVAECVDARIEAACGVYLKGLGVRTIHRQGLPRLQRGHQPPGRRLPRPLAPGPRRDGRDGRGGSRMSLLPISQAAAIVHCHPSQLGHLCRTGMLANARKQKLLTGNLGWFVDLSEVREMIRTKDAFGLARSGPWSPVVRPAPDGELSELQYAVLAAEGWHDLEDIQPDSSAPGAVRASWSDGEAFTVYVDGETDRYTYRLHAWQQKLPAGPTLLALRREHSAAEIAVTYGVHPNTVRFALSKARKGDPNRE